MSRAEKQEVATREADAIAPSETAAVLQMIERAAQNPAVDLEKLKGLFELRNQVIAQQAERSFNDAMTSAQQEMRPIATDSENPSTRSKYASYAALDRAIRPVYTKNGFSLSFNTEPGAPAEQIRIVCIVSCGGHTRKYQVDMPADGKGAKGGDVMTKTHAAGSGMTYGQRYLLKLIFNIAIGDVADDDGNAAGSEPISGEQLIELRALIDVVDADIPKFCAFLKVPSLSEISKRDFPRAIHALNAKKQGGKK